MARYGAFQFLLVAILFAWISTSSIPLPIEEPRALQVYSARADVKEDWRLPEHIRPVWYLVRLLPFMDEGNFLTEGYVEIFVDCLEDTRNITLNSAVTIIGSSVSVVRSDNNLPINIQSIETNTNYQLVTIFTEATLMRGSKYKIQMKFHYTLTDTELKGFYLSSYDERGVKKWLAVTQFETVYARRAFPCFDEPEFKAIFHITLGRKYNWETASNMPIKETTPIDGQLGYVWDVFHPTVKMSTYLVAFLVSEYDYVVSDPALSNVQFRIWTRPDFINYTEYAAEMGPKISEFFEDFFQIDYALPKQDMTSVPDFTFGAMENWGLITYRESALIYNPAVDTLNRKQSIADIIAHELAHQWTGNLVTCKWWSVIWLNEGFAQLLQNYGTDAVQPQFKVFETFTVRTFQPVLVFDSVPVRPLNYPVTLSQLENMETFDSIPYSKGACVIRMMADFLGDDTFRFGMKRYLLKMSYQNAEQDDLFNALNEQAVEDQVTLPASVKTIMDTWTLQMGYPLITVTRDYTAGTATVHQERFLRVPSDDETVYKWWVPLTYNTTTQSSITWINETDTTVDFQAGSSEWVLVNIDQKGYYRVKYDSINYALLRDQLITAHTRISSNNRAQLLDDTFNLALLGHVSYSDAFSLTLYLVKERHYSPWHAVLPELDYIHFQMLNSPAADDWRQYMHNLIVQYYSYVEFHEYPSDEYLTILARSNTINWACRLGVTDCQQKASASYAAWRAASFDQEVISRHQKSTILCAGIENGDADDWDYAYNRFLNPLDPSERSTILGILGCTTNSSIHNRMFDVILNRPSGVSSSDGRTMFNSLARNPSANAAAFKFLDDNWTVLHTSYGASAMAEFVATVSSRFNSQNQLTELQKLIDKYQNSVGNTDSVQGAIRTVNSNIEWFTKNGAVIGDFVHRESGDLWRLRQDIVPVSYNVRLLPFIEEGNFTTDGYVEMIVDCNGETNYISFNTAEIDLDKNSVKVVISSSNQDVPIAEVIEEPARERVTIKTANPLTKGTRYTVSMKFVSQLNNQNRGFYRSSYVENGVRKWLAVTQFEAPDARRAFPCFDEPHFKATFTVTLGHRDSWRAVSNMPLISTRPMDGVSGFSWSEFEPSVVMSTYLVAFLVSEFENNSMVHTAREDRNITFGYWSRPEFIDLTSYAMGVSPDIHDYLEDYFDINYPIAKQDQAGIPDFNAGAMENWGLITYRELRLLYNESKDTASYKQSIAEVISHELLHQWLGNIVTCKWWNVIWLNEGFARYFQYLATDAAEPGYGEMEQFPVKTLQPVMITDSAPTSRPINIPVSSPAESDRMFDSITYDKASCVIRMMAHAMGEDTFKRAMRLYVDQMQYKAADQDDLFSAWNAQLVTEGMAFPVTVKTIMDTWTFQMGYPLITITRNYATGSADVFQERFLRIPSSEQKVYRWWVPLTYKTASSATSTVWISELSNPNVDLKALSSEWVLANIDQNGYYRVKYDSRNYELIRDQLNADHTVISVNNRVQLLDDAFNLALLNHISYANAMDLTLYLAKEQSYSPWHGVLPELEYIHFMMLNSPSANKWQDYVKSLVTPYFQHTGFVETPTDLHLTILSRSNSINWACNRLAVSECLQTATAQFGTWLTSSVSTEVISRNQKSIVLCAALGEADENNWNKAFDRFLNPLEPDERNVIRVALACTKTPTMQSRLLEQLIIPTEGFTPDDGATVFTALANNPSANGRTFEFLRDRWDQLATTYNSSLPAFFQSVSTRYNSQAQLDQLLALRELHQDVLGLSAVAQQAISTVESNIKWMESSGQVVMEWLNNH